jgi:cold shock CspA family protein
MKGRVKFFSQSKGYGYIVGDEQRAYYVTVRDVQGAELPRNGDLVNFEPTSNQRGPKAINVEITQRSRSKDELPGRTVADTMQCPHCQKQIIPRLIVKDGRPDSSVCPYCGHIVRSFSGFCFIATRVFGEDSREVMVLRHFRDAVLKRSALGRGAIALYYRCAPWLSRRLAEGSSLTRLVRWTLGQFVKYLDTPLSLEHDPSLVVQQDSRELGVCAYAPRLERPYSVFLQVLRGQLRVVPRENDAHETARLVRSKYLVEMPLPAPFPNAVALDALMTSSQVQVWLQTIQRGARVGRDGVRFTPVAAVALERLRLTIATVPAFDGQIQPVRTSLELWMHWYSPSQFGSEAAEFRDAPVLRRLIVQDAHQYGIELFEDRRQQVVFN